MLDYKNSRLVVESDKVEPAYVAWRSPSNIALIKYWGKYGVQLPRNPSISLTLGACFTEMMIEYAPKEIVNNQIDLSFKFHQAENEPFRLKILEFLNSLVEIFPFLRQLELKIQSGNSFPHSAGIASSASSMSALALCLCSMEDKLFGTLQDQAEFDKKASYIARLGSGSACRSIFSKAALWGKSSEFENSSDEFAIPYEENLHPIFENYHNAVLIVSKDEKSVSSRVGHALMEDNIYAENRYVQAKQRLQQLSLALKTGDIETFGKIVEDEALTLHALMMCSNPSFILMHPNTLKIINIIRKYREDTQLPVYFTLDAGPNVHLLYPDDIKAEVQLLIDNQLVPLCEDNAWIKDWVGDGPEEL